MTSLLTNKEIKYIKAMFIEDDQSGKLNDIKDIKQLPLSWIGLFMDNREQDSRENCKLDYNISEKYLAAHGLPDNMTYAQWSKWNEKNNTKTL